MKSYRLDPDRLKGQTRNVILLYGITLVAMLILNFLRYRGQEVNSNTYLTLGLITVMFVLVGWNSIKQRKALWDQYEIIVDDSGIRQKQPKAAEMFVPRAEISGFKESKFGLTLMVKNGKPVMGIPKMLTPADYEEIKGIVNGWVQNAKPVVLDVEVIEDVRALLPEDEIELEPEVEPGDLSLEIPEDQQPPELPEA